MALYRCGSSGGTIDFSNPDVVHTVNLAKNATVTIPVTQKPRYIIACRIRSSSAYYGAFIVCDVEKAEDRTIGYGSDGYYNNHYEDVIGYSTSTWNEVSNSQVIFKNLMAYAIHAILAIYY